MIVVASFALVFMGFCFWLLNRCDDQYLPLTAGLGYVTHWMLHLPTGSYSLIMNHPLDSISNTTSVLLFFCFILHLVFFFPQRFTFKLFNLTVSPCVAYCTLSAKISSFLRLNFIKSVLSFGHTTLWLARCFPLWRTVTRPIMSMGSCGHFPAARDDIEMCVSLSVYK